MGNIKKFLIISVITILSIVFLSNLFIFPQKEVFVQADSGCQDHNVQGWAWSENIGWISFSCENCDSDLNGSWDGGDCGTGSSVDYGVDIDSSGVFSGYAWSENIGWISFNSSDLSGCPSGTCEAKVNLSTGDVSGWARALAHGGGWDGWIKLRGTAQDSSSYGVSITTTGATPHEFHGWAWGGDDNSSEAVVGWISFNCSNQSVCSTSDYKVTTDFVFSTKPTVSNPYKTWDYCADSLHPILNWDYSDGTSDGYEVQIATDINFKNIILDTTSDADDSYSYHPISGCPPFSNASCDLSYGTTYYWRVKAKNEDGVWSGWSTTDSFSTPDHKFPTPDFYWSPNSPKVGERVNFTDETTWGTGANKFWFWTIPDATYRDPTSSTSQNPIVTFDSVGAKSVTLNSKDSSLSEIGDCGPGCCSIFHDVTVKEAIYPMWKEIHPK